jgi:hypothetical protein
VGITSENERETERNYEEPACDSVRAVLEEKEAEERQQIHGAHERDKQQAEPRIQLGEKKQVHAVTAKYVIATASPQEKSCLIGESPLSATLHQLC